MIPAWLGRKYPTFDDLVEFAWKLGAFVIIGATPIAFCTMPGPEGVAVIGIPEDRGPLGRTWGLAHELGHLVQHTGPRGALLWSKDEAQANRWAACALIPEAAIRRHANASLDAFIGALSRHYEDIPLIDCPERALAAEIARIRLQSLADGRSCRVNQEAS